MRLNFRLFRLMDLRSKKVIYKKMEKEDRVNIYHS
jgi:hypothetical protein